MSTRKPTFSPGKALFTKLAGVSFVYDFEQLTEGLQPGDDLVLVKEPENEHDPNAISVSLPTGEHLGYIPRDIAKDAPDSLANYSVIVSRVYPGSSDLNSGLGVTVYRNDITEDELIDSVKDILSAEDVADFVLLAYDAVGEPTLGATHEISSRLRIRNVIHHLHKSGVDLKAVLFGDDLTKAIPPGIKVVSEEGLTTLYADDIHRLFDPNGGISLTGYVLREVTSTITGHEVSVAHLDDLDESTGDRRS